MPENTFGPFVGMLVGQLPYYLVWLVGLIIATVYSSRYPRPALLTTLAIGMMFLASVVYCYLWSETSRHQWPDGVSERTWRQSLTWVHNVVRALGYGLLFCAIFGWRQTLKPRPFDHRDESEDTELDNVGRTGDPDPRIRTRPKRTGE
jgi:hypothetical protein